MHNECEVGERIVLPAIVVDRWRAFEAARHQWPEIELGFAEFSHHLDMLGYSQQLPKYASSVYLCAACARGSRVAIKVLESEYFSALQDRMACLATQKALVDDVLQSVRERLLVGSPARIATYKGEGTLSAWLGVIASNAMRDQLRGRREQFVPYDTVACEPYRDGENDTHCPEDHVFGSKYASVLELMVIRAVQALEPEERQLLQLRYLGGLSIDEVARRYPGHRSTAARRILRSTRRVATNLRRQIVLHFGPLEDGEFESFLPSLKHYSTLQVDELLGPVHHSHILPSG